MRSLIRPALALLALTPFLSARLEENLPVTTYGLVKVESLEKTRKNLEGHPLAEAFKNAHITDLLKPVLDKMRSEADSAEKIADFEKHADEIAALFKGELIFAVVNTPEVAEGHQPYDYVVLADTDADEAKIADLLKKLELHQPTPAKGAEAGAAGEKTNLKPQAEEDEDEDEAEPLSSKNRPKFVAPEFFAADEEHHGITLHTLQVKVSEKPVTVAGWAIVDKTFIYTTAPNVLRELVDARKSGRKDNFAEQPVYKINREAIGDADLWLLLNGPQLTTTLRKFVQDGNTGPDGKPTPGLLGMDILKTYDSLALDVIEHARLAVTLKPDDTHFDSSLSWTEKRGILKLIAVPKDATPDLSFIPSGTLGASAARFDFTTMFAELEKLIKEALPLAAPMIDMQLDRVKEQQGLDLRGALLANFGDEGWSFVDKVDPEDTRPEAMQRTVIVTSLKDENKLSSFIETLAGKAGEQTGDGAKALFDERELLGVKIRTVKNLPPTMPRIQYAINKGRLFLSIGEGKLLDRVIAQFNDPKGGLASEPAFKDTLAKLPKNPFSVTYYDVGEYTSLLATAFVTGFNANRGANQDVPKLDVAKAPKAADIPFILVGGSYLGEHDLTSHSVLVRKTDANR